MPSSFYDQPILNSPYLPPTRHHVLDVDGQPQDLPPAQGRRRSELITPVPRPKKTKSQQASFVMPDAHGLSTKEQEYNPTPIINEIRGYVETWRTLPNPADWGVTPATQQLLAHWRQHPFQTVRPFFCQVEAVETIIWLTEVAPRDRRHDKFRRHLHGANEQANPGLFRMAMKMATGSGKTTVMAMLIAWQTVNAVRTPASPRYSRGFLIVAPGITIKDRLRVLQPNDPDSYYRSRELVPPSMYPDIDRAKIVVVNYHAFKPRETMEANKVGRQLLQGPTGAPLATLETDGQMLRRVADTLMGFKGVVLLNDEAHHCYREKAVSDEDLDADGKEEAKANRAAARLWIAGLEAVKRTLGITALYDLSATPFFLRGSGYREGTLFPWTVSDFSLMDAIESGIVKLPRIPVADNLPSGAMPLYRNLWEHIGKKMPKAGRAKMGRGNPMALPNQLYTALYALYGHYEKVFKEWEMAGINIPPVFIVVCSNTAVSELVYEWVSGFERDGEGEQTPFHPGHLPLFSNYDEYGARLPRPNTLLIDSAQVESGEALDPAFREMAAPQIERFRQERVQREGAAAGADPISDADLLREVMNTVGKAGRLGEAIRCVVSVSMLTEGWDTNNVTHILGVRAFGTQLLCEQVVGRGLRRLSYDLNRDGMFEPEYADIMGIPFDFAAQPVVAAPKPPPVTTRVQAVRERAALEITFPRVEGYRVALPDERVEAPFHRRLPPGADAGAGRAVQGADGGPRRQGRGAGRGRAGGDAAQHRGLRVGQAPAVHPLRRLRRRAEDAPDLRPQAPGQPLARRRLPGVPRRDQAGAGAVSRVEGARLRADPPRLPARRPRPRRPARRARSLHPHGQQPLRRLLHLQAPLQDPARPLPRQLRRAGQRLGSRVCPRGRGAPARAGLRQEPGNAVRGALPRRGQQPPLLARLHRPPRRRPPRPAQPGGRDQGLPRQRRATESRNDAQAVGARRQPPRQPRPLGLRRVPRGVRHRGRLRRPGRLPHPRRRRGRVAGAHTMSRPMKPPAGQRPAKPATGPRPVEALTHAETRRNIPTAEHQDLAQRAEARAPVPPARYARADPLPPGETRPRDPDLDPQLIWRGVRIRLTQKQREQLQETGEAELGEAQLAWRGKDAQDWSDLVVNPPPVYIQEKVEPKAVIAALQRDSRARARAAETDAPDLFAGFDGPDDPEARLEFYQHEQPWSNRMILGDSLQVMASLAEREGLRGRVQCIYMDPPYGIKFNSNWQVSTISRDVKDGKREDVSREPEQVKAFRDTWKDGIHSYLSYLRDRLTVARELLTESGSIFVQIGDENVHRVRAVMDEVFGAKNVSNIALSQWTNFALLTSTRFYLVCKKSTDSFPAFPTVGFKLPSSLVVAITITALVHLQIIER